MGLGPVCHAHASRPPVGSSLLCLTAWLGRELSRLELSEDEGVIIGSCRKPIIRVVCEGRCEGNERFLVMALTRPLSGRRVAASCADLRIWHYLESPGGRDTVFFFALFAMNIRHFVCDFSNRLTSRPLRHHQQQICHIEHGVQEN
jgi:hypothetical protein